MPLSGRDAGAGCRRSTETGTVLFCHHARMARLGTEWRRRRPVILVLTVVGALAGCGGWWWTHATVLDDRLGGAGVGMAPRPLDEATLHASVAIPAPRGDADEVLTFRAVGVRFDKNTAGATAQLSVCVPRDEAGVIGAVTGPLARYCEVARLVTPGTAMRWREGHPPTEYLVLTIIPTRAGVARIGVVEIDYSRDRAHLWQRGSVRAHADITMRATNSG